MAEIRAAEYLHALDRSQSGSALRGRSWIQRLEKVVILVFFCFYILFTICLHFVIISQTMYNIYGGNVIKKYVKKQKKKLLIYKANTPC